MMMMAKPWTREHDEFLFAYFDGMGDFIGVHDLGRPEGAATARVAKLKACGAWAAMEREQAARADYYRALGKAVPGEDAP